MGGREGRDGAGYPDKLEGGGRIRTASIIPWDMRWPVYGMDNGRSMDYDAICDWIHDWP